MPELPELEILVSNLRNRIKDKTLGRPIIINPKVISGDSNLLEDKMIKDVMRRGKWVLISLDEMYIAFHLRLNGYIFLVDYGEADSYDCIILPVDGEYIHFGDPRRLAQMKITSEIDSLIEELGVDPLSKDFTLEYLSKSLKKKRGNIKTFLMDQDIISGIGNTYADEILFWAKINPTRPCQSLSKEEIEALYNSIKNTLEEALKLGGTSTEEFTNLISREKSFEPKVHRKEGDQCPICDTPIVMIKIGGRGTYYCPRCQK
ncbi:MAG: DNA-formamidopyrimidine glycosylase [bacterium]|nr:DNA-formamidopyrimidine glycosylase [bacterium]